MTFDPNELEASAIYKLLTGTIIPRPIGWISSISEDGINNLAPFSYFNMLGDDPPHVMFSTRRDNNKNKDTLNNVLTTKQFVVNMVTEDVVEQMNTTSQSIPPDESEFDLARLEQAASSQVKVPRVALAPLALECRLAKLQPYPPENPSCEVIFAEVLAIYINPSLLDANGMPDPHKMDLISRIGGSGYSRVAADIFQLARPASAVRR